MTGIPNTTPRTSAKTMPINALINNPVVAQYSGFYLSEILPMTNLLIPQAIDRKVQDVPKDALV